MQYDAKKLKFACEYCQSDFTEQELEKHFGKFDEKLNEESKPEPEQAEEGTDEFYQQAALYVCQSCGAEVIAETNTAATFCVYCHNPIVLSNRLAGNFKPNRVIPFKISEKDAKQKFLDFCGKKKFLPNDFLSEGQMEMMKGVYYPYWLVDSKKRGGIRATGKIRRKWREGDYEIEETKIYKIVRAGDIDFKNFPHAALKDPDNKKALKYVNPFDDDEARPFTMSYLSGFLAEKRDLERKDAQNDVDKELEKYAEKIYRETIEGYDSVTVDGMDLKTLTESWAYALMPVWVMTFKYKDKDYMYAMNGQTGKNYGELPVSAAKLAAFGIGLFLAIFIILVLWGYLR